MNEDRRVAKVRTSIESVRVTDGVMSVSLNLCDECMVMRHDDDKEEMPVAVTETNEVEALDPEKLCRVAFSSSFQQAILAAFEKRQVVTICLDLDDGGEYRVEELVLR